MLSLREKVKNSFELCNKKLRTEDLTYRKTKDETQLILVYKNILVILALMQRLLNTRTAKAVQFLDQCIYIDEEIMQSCTTIPIHVALR